MSDLKVSRYNFCLRTETGTVLVYNASTGAFLEFPDGGGAGDELARVLAAAGPWSASAPEPDLEQELVTTGMLVPRECDEIGRLKVRNHMGRFGSRLLELMITLTYDCNFRCTYCSEDRADIQLTEGTARALSRFVRRQIETERQRRLYVHWFGGEPLLRRDLIFALSEDYQDICGEHRCGYGAKLTTNGYLLDGDFVARLDDLRIRHLTVTLDGPRERHDRLRFRPGREPTYEVVLENLRNLLGLPPGKVELEIRTNIDYDDPAVLAAFLDDLEEFRGRCQVSWAFVNHRTGRGRRYARCGEGGDPVAALDAGRINRMLRERGFRREQLPVLRTNYCMGDSRHGYAFDPEGRVYKCSSGVTGRGEYGRPLGRLLASGVIEYDLPEYLRWMGWDAFDDPECRTCKMLPVCMGGCPLIAMHAGGLAALSDVKKHCMVHVFGAKGAEERLARSLGQYHRCRNQRMPAV